MLQFDGSAFFEAVSLIQHGVTFIEHAANNEEQKVKPIRPDTKSAFASTLTRLRTHLLVLNARVTMIEVNRTIGEIRANKDFTYQNLSEKLISISERLQDELTLVYLFAIGEPHLKYLTETSVFGSDIETKLPEMSEDIAEAGKCLAFERPTAAVFHLMRVMELGVQRLGDKLRVPLVNELNWQVILDQVNKAIKKMDHKAAATKQLSEIAAHLYAVKVAWRNEVMHPKQTYTPDEAEMVFTNTRTFVRELSTIL